MKRPVETISGVEIFAGQGGRVPRSAARDDHLSSFARLDMEPSTRLDPDVFAEVCMRTEEVIYSTRRRGKSAGSAMRFLRSLDMTTGGKLLDFQSLVGGEGERMAFSF